MIYHDNFYKELLGTFTSQYHVPSFETKHFRIDRISMYLASLIAFSLHIKTSNSFEISPLNFSDSITKVDKVEINLSHQVAIRSVGRRMG